VITFIKSRDSYTSQKGQHDIFYVHWKLELYGWNSTWKSISGQNGRPFMHIRIKNTFSIIIKTVGTEHLNIWF